MTPEIRLLLVDALNLVRRVYAAQPGEDGPQKAQEGLDSSVRSLQRALGQWRPTHAVAIFDGPGATWRHQLFPDYKAGRRPMPEALREALPAHCEAFAELGVTSIERPGTEADDVIATLAMKATATGGRAIILSTDRGFLQLLSSNITVHDHFRQQDLGVAYVRERFATEPAKLVDLLALSGDGSGSIPGISGIGTKTAVKLLRQFGSFEAVLDAAASSTDGNRPQVSPKLSEKMAEKIVSGTELARLSRQLVELATDLELGLNLKQLRHTSPSQTRPAQR